MRFASRPPDRFIVLRSSFWQPGELRLRSLPSASYSGEAPPKKRVYAAKYPKQGETRQSRLKKRLLYASAQSGFAMSTFTTDYVLVKQDRLAQALVVLEEAGYGVERVSG